MNKYIDQKNTTIMVCGEPGCGKSEISDFFHKFKYKHLSRPPVVYRTTSMTLHEQNFKLRIWDVAISENFKKLLHHYRSLNDVIVYVFDVTSQESYQKITATIEQDDDLDCPKILVGAKSGTNHNRVVSVREAKELANEVGIKYIEVDTKSGENIQLLYEGAVTLAYKKTLDQEEGVTSENNIKWTYSEDSDSESTSEESKTYDDDSVDDEHDYRDYWRKKDPFDRLMSYARFLSELNTKSCSKNDNYAGKEKGRYLLNYFTNECELGSKNAIRALLRNNSNNILNNRNKTGVPWFKVRSFFLGSRNKFQGGRLCESKVEEMLVKCYKTFTKN